MKNRVCTILTLSAICFSCASTPRWNTDDPDAIAYLNTVAGGLQCKWSGRVVDESGLPMTNFAVRMWFERGTTSSQTVHGRTDSNGVFTAEGLPEDRVAFISEEPGWYVSRAEHNFYNFLDYSNIDGDRWLPWNPTNTIVVRPKRNPVPMIHSRVSDLSDDLPDIPLDTPIGLDCEKNSYLPPYGKGSVADFTVEILSAVNGTNEIRFAAVRPGDGFIVRPIQVSDSNYVIDYEAPETGYSPVFSILEPALTPEDYKNHRRYHQWCPNDAPQYVVFRSRSLLSDDGTVTNATHGIFFDDATEYSKGFYGDFYRCFRSIVWSAEDSGMHSNACLILDYRFNPNSTSVSIEDARYEAWSHKRKSGPSRPRIRIQ